MNRKKYQQLGEAAWRGHIKAQTRSGESARGYCEKHGLVVSSFRRWRKELSLTEEESGFIRLDTQGDNPVAGLIITTPNGYRVETANAKVGIATARTLTEC